MFKNDRMMMILTGLVLAIFAGSMVQYGDKIVAMMSGEDIVVTQDDSYSVRAGASQVLDVLSNDEIKGPIVVLSRPNCGTIELANNNRLSFTSDSECHGEVEFAYCVDSEGKCDPNAVKINVISVSYAQAGAAAANAGDQTETAEVVLTEDEQSALEMASIQSSGSTTQPSEPANDAPEIDNFAVEMAPPALAAPSMTELVSPGVAVASIRRATSGLNSASSTDQNIATQNSASVGQTASSSPNTFSAPSIGESSNISLGGSERIVVSNTVTPSGLETVSTGGNNLVQLERGPEALDSLQIAQVAPTAPSIQPLTASPELNGNAPVFVASAQSNSPSLDAEFNAQPVDGGPIALVALNRTPSRGNAAGESLNIVLTEPGLQSFRAPADAPAALAPASAQPIAVSVMERGPSVDERLSAPAPLTFASNLAASLSAFSDSQINRNQINLPTPEATSAPYNEVGSRIVASQPIQAIAPTESARKDMVSRFISVSQNTTHPNRVTAFATLSAPISSGSPLPSLSLQPAGKPQILEASLPVTPEAGVLTAPVQNSACEIALSATATNGANIELEIRAACKPSQMVTIEHSGIAFSVLTDAQGAASVVVPAMEAEARISVEFEDQSSSRTIIFVNDMESVVRAGVSWQSKMDLDLSAIEFGAAIGSEGHITPETPRDYRTSSVKGGGYLLQLGDPSLERGALAEVYTLPSQRDQQRGTIAMSVLITDVTPVCGQNIRAKTVRTREDSSATIRNVRFLVPSCGIVVSGPIALPGAIDDIRLVGR